MRVIALMTLALWGLGLVHCELERVVGLDLVRSCCIQADADCTPDAPCEDDDCASVEDGKYRPEEQPSLVVRPWASADQWVEALEVLLLNELPGSPPDHEPPPELNGHWHLLERAAPPPRAPSLCS
ncbi:MAG: hypothetical protein RI897_680 [Verrucomicrobiota bacterium]